ncbi:MAG TPA: hypothetical protein VF978_02740 [Gemmatimonadales bacterium]
MFRSIIAFAIVAVVAWLALSLAFSLFGLVVGVAVKLLTLAAFGFLAYLALRIVSPSTADKIRDVIKGRPADA